jgi:hypothetical protein
LETSSQAAGYDEPIPSGSSPSLATPNERLRVLSFLNWDKWKNPTGLITTFVEKARETYLFISSSSSANSLANSYQNESPNPK